jgi:hypothetical protein
LNDYELKAKKLWKPWYEKNYAEFKSSVKKSIYEHIKIFRAKKPNAKVYGYSLYTCNGLPHFGPVLNRTDQLKESDNQLYFQFCPDEWSDWDDYSCFDEPNRILESLHREFEDIDNQFDEMYEEGDYPVNIESEDYWQNNIEKIFNELVCCLNELKNEGAFDWLEDQNRQIIIWFSDPSDWEFSMSTRSLKTLINSETARRFSLSLK